MSAHSHNQDPYLPPILEGEDKSSVLKNCLRNNYRHLRKWAKRSATDCFRVYDRHMHHYPLAIDYYAGRFCVHYFARCREELDPSEALQDEVSYALSTLLEGGAKDIFWRTRFRRDKVQQYEKLSTAKEFFVVHEHGTKFYVNLRDYLDTGLFLDHRSTRQIVASHARGKRLLNLFAYTSAFSVQAAMQGAIFTKSVDLSNTYLAWGKDNFALNGLSLSDHLLVRADCLQFLEEEVKKGIKYDLIVIDPPTLSRSKKMLKMFDVQQDYLFLLAKALKLLAKEGRLYFSTNSRQFVFDAISLQSHKIVEITSKTIPADFTHGGIHRCWQID